MWPFPSESKQIKQLYITCLKCCARIENLQKKALSKCKDYKNLVIQEIEAGRYESAEPYADSLLLNMQLEKWYRLVYAHVSTLERDHLKGRVRCCKDVLPSAYPDMLTAVYASTLTGNEMPEMGEIAKLIVKIFGKPIDKYVDQKGYTDDLLRKKYVSLKYVDDDVVHTFPGGLNWSVSPNERLHLVLQMCQSKHVVVRDPARLREAMLGNQTPGVQMTERHSRRSSGTSDDHLRRSHTSHTSYASYTTYTTDTSECADADVDPYDTPTSKLANPKNSREQKDKVKKNRKKKGSGDAGEETWRKFVQMSPGPSQDAEHGTVNTVERAGPSWSKAEGRNIDAESDRRPGWSPPKPKFDGDSLSFGPKLDNVAGFMARRTQEER